MSNTVDSISTKNIEQKHKCVDNRRPNAGLCGPTPSTAAMSFFRDLPVGMGKDKEGTPQWDGANSVFDANF